MASGYYSNGGVEVVPLVSLCNQYRTQRTQLRLHDCYDNGV